MPSPSLQKRICACAALYTYSIRRLCGWTASAQSFGALFSLQTSQIKPWRSTPYGSPRNVAPILSPPRRQTTSTTRACTLRSRLQCHLYIKHGFEFPYPSLKEQVAPASCGGRSCTWRGMRGWLVGQSSCSQSLVAARSRAWWGWWQFFPTRRGSRRGWPWGCRPPADSDTHSRGAREEGGGRQRRARQLNRIFDITQGLLLKKFTQRTESQRGEVSQTPHHWQCARCYEW